MMRLLLSSTLAFGFTLGTFAASNPGDALQAQGQEYPMTRVLRGDQVHPGAALAAGGGFLVWEDNATDGDGAGIGAVHLGSNLSADLESFRVNADAAGDQQRPAVALLDGGGTAFVWQSGNAIRGRVLDAQGVFTTPGDIQVSTHEGTPKVNPVIAPLGDGGFLVLWASYGQDDAGSTLASGGYRHLQGVYGQRFDAAGARVGEEFLLNQEVEFNQRNPAVARLASGKLIALWISERVVLTVIEGQLTDSINAVEVTGRLLDQAGVPQGNAFRISAEGAIAASPSVCAAGGGFAVAWCQIDSESRDIGYEIFARWYDESGLASSEEVKVNSHWYGDQYAPSIASAGGRELIIWTSLLQDGFREGVYGQSFIQGAKHGEEFRVNTTVHSRQIHPRVIARGGEGFLAIWSSFAGSPRDFEIFGQRYGMSLPAAPTPMVSALSANRLSVAWFPVGGYGEVEYLIYMDAATEPAVTSEPFWNTPATLLPSSTHSFRLAYRLPAGTISPLSEAGLGTTWGADENFDGLPDDWQSANWGTAAGSWPGPMDDPDGDGMNNRDEFLAGTDPRDAAKVLRTSLTHTPQGAILAWNATPGQVYQLQESADLKTWNALGGSRFARSAREELLLDGVSGERYYRVVRIR
jgi:hypothetical protein